MLTGSSAGCVAPHTRPCGCLGPAFSRNGRIGGKRPAVGADGAFRRPLTARGSRPFVANRQLGQEERIPGRVGKGWQCRAEVKRAPSFPAGRRQAKIQLPGCFVAITVAEALTGLESLSAALSAGATGVVLIDEADEGGAALYEVGVKVKELIRGRAVLLVLNRTDIVDAIEAEGVVLTPKGLPTLVARRMMQSKDGIIARLVDTAKDASVAAAEGANLILLKGDGKPISEAEISASKTQQGSSGGIPVIVASSSASEARAAAGAGADGGYVQLQGLSRDAAEQVDAVLRAYDEDADILQPTQQPRDPEVDVSKGPEKEEKGIKHFLDASKEALLESERDFLSKTLTFLKEAAPEMEELNLLVDAIKQLDELFLLVIVGEFNSGKSSIINALLGDRYLVEGILPTTNEISVLKFKEDATEEEVVQNADGFYTRKLPAELLRDINIVDTPGTNVIVDRQQRLTEEYVPRADLVLFCMSADRPFTESETSFLKYIRQWGKKVVFVVNKVDILSNDGEVEEVTRFVANSATRLLGVDRTQVLAVSARSALKAKLAIGGGRMAGGILSDADKQALSGQPDWEASRFGKLEGFILDFLVGGASAAESVRLKLQTPLYVADALLEAASQQLAEDLSAAEQDVAALKSVQQQLATFKAEMERDGAAQRGECRKVVGGAIKRAQRLIDSTLQLSNLDGLSTYIFGSRSSSGSLPVSGAFQQEVVGPSSRQLEQLVEEHRSWLTSNCQSQISNYRRFAEARAEQMGVCMDDVAGGANSGSEADAAEQRRRWREKRASSQEGQQLAVQKSDSESAMEVVQAFDPGAGAVLLEEEIRESVINTVGAALGSGGLGVVSTFFLPNTLEDLLAIAVGGAVGYAALLNLPLKRNDAKDKLTRVATNFADSLDQKMQKELEAAVEECIAEVNDFILPLERKSEEGVRYIQGLQSQQSDVMDELGELQQQAASIE